MSEKAKKPAKRAKATSKPAKKEAKGTASGDQVGKVAPVKLTANTKRLLRIRKKSDQNRPRYIRVESWRYGRLHKYPWRAAKGIDNKTHRKYKCGSMSPEVGYRGPRLVRGIHPCGLKDVVVATEKELEKLNPETHCIRIAARLGARKRILLIEKIRAKSFKILNIGMSEKEFAEFEAMLAQKPSETEGTEE
ncbi:MAG TPA: 50S ribosomal protein L32e [Candidatus Lokiarchaeia archaeon]|nr:50S ribosomal protein L32e [Candidatus Lokiarchaeia archaeon]